MVNDSEDILNSLIKSIVTIEEVQSVGISGSKSPLLKAGQGDIDIFIYCDRIPELKKRQNITAQSDDQLQGCKFNVIEGGHWGIGDFVLINGVDTWLMYFTAEETLKEAEAILDGKYPDKLDNYYYPIGRCGMLKNINILYDRNGFLNSLKKRLITYPEKLAEILVHYHLDQLEDTEDLERAVFRKDVLFYHFALDLAIDHYLQALFALNRTYFPSRKRTFDYIRNFKIKPERCSEMLSEVIKLGSSFEDIHQSYLLWNSMVDELKKLESSYCPLSD